jgi:hypothetical protein
LLLAVRGGVRGGSRSIDQCEKAFYKRVTYDLL